jgi:multimeric flavodoxin WrbA
VFVTLKAIAINATLKPSGKDPSSTDKMIDLVRDQLEEHEVEWKGTMRLADHRIQWGVSSDEGDGDEWPLLRRRILEADILVFGTPIWMGQLASPAKLVLERMDAFLSETDDMGRTPASGKLAVAAIVGNEDGAHRCTADLFQALNDVGWTIPAGGATYWVGEAMNKKDFKDLPEVPKQVTATVAALAANAVHLARLLGNDTYPGVKQEA